MSQIDRDSSVPAYRQLADILRGLIESGELRGYLPSKDDLATTYGVSVSGTIDPALQQLAREGLISMARGRRTRIRTQQEIGPSRYRAARANYGPNQESRFAQETGIPWSQLRLERVYTTMPAPPRIAQLLHVEPDALVVRRRWLHVGPDGVPLRVAWSYLDVARWGHTILCDPAEPAWPGGTVAQLLHLGRRPERESPTWVRGRTATDEEAALLDLEPDAPVHEETRVHIEAGPMHGQWTPLEVAVRVYPFGSVVLAYQGIEGRSWPAWQG